MGGAMGMGQGNGNAGGRPRQIPGFCGREVKQFANNRSIHRAAGGYPQPIYPHQATLSRSTLSRSSRIDPPPGPGQSLILNYCIPNVLLILESQNMQLENEQVNRIQEVTLSGFVPFSSAGKL